MEIITFTYGYTEKEIRVVLLIAGLHSAVFFKHCFMFFNVAKLSAAGGQLYNENLAD